MMYTVCNRPPLLCEKIVLWLLQLYITQQRVSLFCAIFGIYSFIVAYFLQCYKYWREFHTYTKDYVYLQTDVG